MSKEFDPDIFMEEEVTRERMVRLKKAELWRLAQALELDLTEGLTKTQLVMAILPWCNEEEWKADLARQEADLARQDRERERALEKEKIVHERAKLALAERGQEEKARFDVNKCFSLVPRFDSGKVESFFEMFEKIARQREWPQNQWVTLIQSSLTGKAQEAYLALSPQDSEDYDKVRQAVLKVFELVPEAYRQQFRSERPRPGQTYMDFARQQEAAFDKWVRASEVYGVQQLRELMILEQFKQGLPKTIQVHLNDLGVSTVCRAAEAADNYVLVHKDAWHDKPEQGRRFRDVERRQGGKPDGGWRSSVHEKDRNDGGWRPPALERERNSAGGRPPVNFRQGGRPHRPSSFPADIICHYCNKPGLIKSRCSEYQRREASRSDSSRSVPINAMGVTPTAGPVQAMEKAELEMFSGFVSDGAVAVEQGKPEAPVTVLRDTASGQSVLVAGTLDLPESSAVGTVVPIKGFGGTYNPVPLYRVFVRTNVFVGYAQVGVVSELPVRGVTFLLGNDIAQSQVVVTPCLSSTPCEVAETRALEEEYPVAFPVCAVTRAQAKVSAVSPVAGDGEAAGTPSVRVKAPPIALADTGFAKWCGMDQMPVLNRNSLIEDQKQDHALSLLRETAVPYEERKDMAEGFFLKDGVLLRKFRPPDRPVAEEWAVLEQIVLPPGYRQEVLQLAHETPLAGHLGIRKTQARIMKHFYWPQLHKDVVSFCRSCHPCQLAGKPNQRIPVAPLTPIPVVEEPFSKVIIDCVGPLPKTRKGNEFLLTIMDVTTRFPEAVPLRDIKARTIIGALVNFFSRFGLPRQVQHDRGSNFVSGVFQEVMVELGISQAVSSAYHPESQGALERAHQTLKTILKTYSIQFPGDWDTSIPFVLFAVRDSVSESTGFSPFELVFGHEVRGPLKLLKEQLLQPKPGEPVLQYVTEFKDRLQAACQVARDNLEKAQERMKAHNARKAVERSFVVGDQVLALVPQRQSSLSASFSGPYTVMKKVSDKNYVIHTPEGRRKSRLCHINLLKKYQGRVPATPVMCVLGGRTPDEDDSREVGAVGLRLGNTEALQSLEKHLAHLPAEGQLGMKVLVAEFSPLFQDVPGRTSLAVHDVDVGSATPIKQHPYRLAPSKLQILKEEVSYMLKIGAIERGQSAWSSPVVLVPKPDDTSRPCIDYRKVNQVTKADAFPIPRLEDCIDRIGRAQVVSKLDLLKGYWQVPLTPNAKEISAFVTPEGLYLCNVLPFGMKNAPATFQRLMNTITNGMSSVVTYIDDVVVFSSSWEEHLVHLRQLFEKLLEADLVVNLPKCEFGKGQVTYLGHEVGQGKVMPRQAKVAAILDLPQPKNRRDILRVLGMCGFYRRFVPNFAAVTAPLTNLLKKNVKFVWADICEQAFAGVKSILACEPVLLAPNFEAPFKLAVDACDIGVGAVLLQSDENGLDRPVAYFSRKLNVHQRAYSTIEKEALGLVLAVRHFEVYVSHAGREVEVYTDHNPLAFLARFQTSNQRVFRWALVLQPYSLVVRHVAGKDNILADTLSRMPVEGPT